MVKNRYLAHNEQKSYPQQKLILTLLFLLALFLLLQLFLGVKRLYSAKKEEEPPPAGGELIWEKTEDFSTNYDYARGVAVDSTGVYTAGVIGVRGNYIWRVEKRSLDGNSLIWEENIDFSGMTSANGIAVDSTGVYIVGWQDGSTAYNLGKWRVEKRNLIDGSLIWGKGEDLSSTGQDEAMAVAVDDTGVYVVGRECYRSGGTYLWRVEKRSLDDGSVIWSERLGNPGYTSYIAKGVAVDSTGVYIVGRKEGINEIEKRNLDNGSRIWGSGSDIGFDPQAVAVDSTGVYIAGGRGVSMWRVQKRNLNDGSLIWNKEDDFYPLYTDWAEGIAVDSTGVYVVGHTNERSFWRVEKRSPDDGSLIWGREEDLSTVYDVAYGVALDSTGIYVVGLSGRKWRVEKRKKVAYIDIGLRVWAGGPEPVKIAAEPVTPSSALRIAKDGVTYGIVLVEPGDPMDSGVRIKTGSGEIKALGKL